MSRNVAFGAHATYGNEQVSQGSLDNISLPGGQVGTWLTLVIDLVLHENSGAQNSVYICDHCIGELSAVRSIAKIYHQYRFITCKHF